MLLLHVTIAIDACENFYWSICQLLYIYGQIAIGEWDNCCCCMGQLLLMHWCKGQFFFSAKENFIDRWQMNLNASKAQENILISLEIYSLLPWIPWKYNSFFSAIGCRIWLAIWSGYHISFKTYVRSIQGELFVFSTHSNSWCLPFFIYVHSHRNFELFYFWKFIISSEE